MDPNNPVHLLVAEALEPFASSQQECEAMVNALILVGVIRDPFSWEED